MKNIAALTALSLCFALALNPGCATPPSPIVIDGFTYEWRDARANDPTVTDAAGDANGPTDVLNLAGRRMGEHVFLRLTIAQPANLHKPAEGGGLRINVAGDGEWVTLDTGLRQTERNGQPVPFALVDYVGLPTHASPVFEVRFKAPPGPLTVTLDGSDTLDRPLHLPASGPDLPLRKVDVARGDTPLRVVAWNVLHGGPFDDPEREAAGREVLEALDADVLLLQEVWEIENFAQKVKAVCGEDWAVQEVGGVAVASKLPMTLLEVGPPVALDDRRRPAGGDRWSVERSLFVGIDADTGPVVVVSAHWKCCGSMGSSEDISRMDDAVGALKAIWRLRDAAIPAEPRRDGSTPYKAPVPARFANAPLLIAGDYNLVGSRAPLDMLLTQGLVDLVPLQTDEWVAATWRSPRDEQMARSGEFSDRWEPGGFPTGRLDLAVADRRLNVLRSFVADLGEPTELSDHLPVVVDIGHHLDMPLASETNTAE